MDWYYRRMPLPSSSSSGSSSWIDRLIGRGRLHRPLTYLADYGGNINTFLECVPTYLHTPAGLQAGNVEIMSYLADLRRAQVGR